MISKIIKLFHLVILIAILVTLFGQSDARAETDTFPLPPVIQPNVTFWKKIYTEYSTRHGVLHDSRRLDIIYGVIELVDPDRHGGRKTNKKRIKKAKKKYKAILAKLMRGETPAGPLEKKVAQMFGPRTKPAEYRSAMRRIRCQTGQKDRFRDGIIRSGAYVDEIRRIFRNSGLPEDLAYLPHVESSFNPKAYSKFGAAGMWQFTRSTGKYYMKVGYTIDERRDPIISSHAAAKLLKHNYRKLKNWPMAITAYNHGVSGMLRARRKKGSYERIFTEYRSRIFKFASRNFYSEFLAAREAAINYRQYFGELKLNKPVKSREVVLKGYVSLPQLARHLNFGIAELRKLNPALRRPVFRGQKYVPKGYRLRLPYSNDEDFAVIVAKIDDKFYKHYQRKSRIYTVQRGDTAGEIARIHGVKLQDLIAVNNLNSRATIYVNQNLRIPLPDEKPPLIAKHQPRKMKAVKQPVVPEPTLSETQTASLEKSDKQSAPDRQTVKPVAAKRGQNYRVIEAQHAFEPKLDNGPEKAGEDLTTDTPAGSSDDSLFVEYPMAEYRPAPKEPAQSADAASVVSDLRGETAPSVSPINSEDQIPARAALDQPAEEMKAAGPAQASPSALSVERAESGLAGNKLVQSTAPSADSPQNNPEVIMANLVVKKTWKHEGKQVGIIRVDVEETLGHYAEWLNVSAREIRRLNGLRYGRALHLNQKIKIPLHRVTREEFAEKRFEYHQELAEDFFASYRVEKVRTYSIKRGDNIWTLSHQEFEVPLWLIKRYNANVDFSALVPSQTLVIPVIEEKNV